MSPDRKAELLREIIGQARVMNLAWNPMAHDSLLYALKEGFRKSGEKIPDADDIMRAMVRAR